MHLPNKNSYIYWAARNVTKLRFNFQGNSYEGADTPFLMK